MSGKEGQGNLRELLELICKSYGSKTFTSYEIYSTLLESPKKNGGRRHYTLTYSEVKQNLARADYIEKVQSTENNIRIAVYRNKTL